MSKPTLKKDIRTRHLLAFEDAYNAAPEVRGKYNVAVRDIKAAITAGFFENGFNAEQLGDLPPSDTIKLQTEINRWYKSVNETDPN